MSLLWLQSRGASLQQPAARRLMAAAAATCLAGSSGWVSFRHSYVQIALIACCCTAMSLVLCSHMNCGSRRGLAVVA